MLALFAVLGHVPTYGSTDQKCIQPPHVHTTSQAIYLKGSGGLEVHTKSDTDPFDTVNGELIDFDAVFKKKYPKDSFHLYVGCGGEHCLYTHTHTHRCLCQCLLIPYSNHTSCRLRRGRGSNCNSATGAGPMGRRHHRSLHAGTMNAFLVAHSTFDTRVSHRPATTRPSSRSAASSTRRCSTRPFATRAIFLYDSSRTATPRRMSSGAPSLALRKNFLLSSFCRFQFSSY